jgi:transcriptional regulator with XRE-family HTH domain
MSTSVIHPLSLTFLRERSGVPMPELAKLCGVDRSTLYGWASKHRTMGADDVRSVAKALLLNDADELALFRWAAEPREATPSNDTTPSG